MDQLWPDCVVEENNLTVIISALRKVLGDEREQRRYIVTIPGTGYSFVADTVESEDPPALLRREAASRQGEEESSIDKENLPGTIHPLMGISIGAKGVSAVIVLSLALALAVAWAARRGITGHASTQSAVAVLPFESVGFGADADFLRLGVADALVERLRRRAGIRVFSLSDLPAYQNSAYDPSAAGKSLGVSAILTGTVRKTAGTVSVSARLLSVKDRGTLWSGDFNGEMKDILTIQDRIADGSSYALTHERNVESVQRQRPPLTTDPDAYQLYLHGLFFLDHRTHYQNQESLQKAIYYLEQAVQKDPQFAAAYASLARTYNRLNWYVPPENSVVRAEALAEKALSLDPNLPDAYRVLAYTKQTYEWDSSSAIAAYRRSLELDPSESTTHRWYADSLVAAGRSQEAVNEARKGLELDPTSAELDSLGHVYFFSRRYEEALQELQSKQDVDPNVSWFLAWLYTRPGTKADMFDAGSPERSRTNSPGACELAYAQALAGRVVELAGCLRHLSQKNDVSPYNIALLYVALNDRKSALEWLERARQAHVWELIFINVDPRLDSLRSDPRWETFVEGMHMHQT